MDAFFRDKVIVITGASSGIGLAAARLFASYGAKLSLGARSIDKLNALASEMTDTPSRILCFLPTKLKVCHRLKRQYPPNSPCKERYPS